MAQETEYTFPWGRANTVTDSEVLPFVVAELERHPRFDWVGVYWLEDDELVLRAWKGPEATEHVRIPVGQGICGLAARTGETVNVPDVNADERYLACFPSTRSELVVPVRDGDGNVVGEIDIDSDKKGDFTPDQVALAEGVAEWLGRTIPSAGTGKEVSVTTEENLPKSSVITE